MEATIWIEALRCQRVDLGDSASPQHVNAEQISKRVMRKPTRLSNGEDRRTCRQD